MAHETSDTSTLAAMPTPELHITIAAMAMPGEFNDVRHEARLVKAALLYADRVTLVSPKVTMLAAIASVVGGGDEARRAAFDQFMAVVPGGEEVRRDLEMLRRKKRKTVEELLQLRRAEERVDKLSLDMVKSIEGMIDAPSVDELGLAMSEGGLILHPLGLERPDVSAQDMVREFSDVLANMVAPSSTTQPMFDDAAGSLVRSMLREGYVEGPRLEGATQVALAGRYIDKVHAFPDAPMQAILEARSELSVPLVGFRAALGDLAAEARTTPLEEDFGAVADSLYQRTVAPRLQELSELAEERRIPTLLRREAMQAGAGMKAVVALVLTNAADLPAVVQASAAAIAVAVDVGAGVINRRADIDRERRANQFLWLYEADQRLVPG